MQLKKFKDKNGIVYYYQESVENFESLSTYSKTCRSDLVIDGREIIKCKWSFDIDFIEKLVDNYLLEQKGEEEVNA